MGRPARPDEGRVVSRSACARPCTRTPQSSFARTSVITRTANEKVNSLTGEWENNWSLASYEDVGQYFEDNLFKEDASPGASLSDIMSKDITTTTPETSIDELKELFETVTGLPVVDATGKLVGVVSKKDLGRPGFTVKDIMSTPPVASRADSKVADAAVLMLKHKVHRVPIVDDDAKVVGIVTRTDVFTGLALETGSTDILSR